MEGSHDRADGMTMLRPALQPQGLFSSPDTQVYMLHYIPGAKSSLMLSWGKLYGSGS